MDTLQPKKSKKVLWIIVGIFLFSWIVNNARMDGVKEGEKKSKTTTSVTTSQTPNQDDILKTKITLNQSEPDIYNNGDVTIHVIVTNRSSKSIKYVYIKTKFYNNVNDILENSKGKEKFIYHRIVGEIKPGQSKSLNGIGFRNDEVVKAISKLDSVIFTDGQQINY